MASKTNKNPPKGATGEGRRIGGDDAVTYEWPDADDPAAGTTLTGKIVSIGLAGTKYGNRTRVVLEERDGGEHVGLWLPERWHVTFTAETQIGDRVSLRRFLKETKGGQSQVAYEIRVL